MGLDVISGSTKTSRVVTEMADADIASRTKQAADPTSYVVMIDVKLGLAPAKKAEPLLRRGHAIVVIGHEPVLLPPHLHKLGLSAETRLTGNTANRAGIAGALQALRMRITPAIAAGGKRATIRVSALGTTIGVGAPKALRHNIARRPVFPHT